MAVEDLAAVLAVAEDLVAAEAVDFTEAADLEAALTIVAHVLATVIIIARASLGGVLVTTVMAVDLPAVVWEAF